MVRDFFLGLDRRVGCVDLLVQGMIPFFFISFFTEIELLEWTVFSFKLEHDKMYRDETGIVQYI